MNRKCTTNVKYLGKWFYDAVMSADLGSLLYGTENKHHFEIHKLRFQRSEDKKDVHYQS